MRMIAKTTLMTMMKFHQMRALRLGRVTIKMTQQAIASIPSNKSQISIINTAHLKDNLSKFTHIISKDD